MSIVNYSASRRYCALCTHGVMAYKTIAETMSNGIANIGKGARLGRPTKAYVVVGQSV